MAIDNFPIAVATVGVLHTDTAQSQPNSFGSGDVGVYCISFTAESDGSEAFSLVLPIMNGFFARIALIKYSEYKPSWGSGSDHEDGTLTLKDRNGLSYTATTGTSSTQSLTLSPTLLEMAGSFTLSFASIGVQKRIRVAIFITGSPT